MPCGAGKDVAPWNSSRIMIKISFWIQDKAKVKKYILNILVSHPVGFYFF